MRCVLLRGLRIVLVLIGWGAMGVSMSAAGDQDRSFVLTPQVWLSHIAKNGFQTPSSSDLFALKFSSALGFSVPASCCNIDTQSVDAINPQWGLQLALQKDAWTVALSGQYVSFTTRNDFSLTANAPIGTYTIQAGATVAQEFIDTDRFDFDLAVSHFFPDAIPEWLDLSAGLGVKFIYAHGTRNWDNILKDAPSEVQAFADPFFLYPVCPQTTNTATCRLRKTVSEDDFYYGATVPISVSLYPIAKSPLVIPVNVSPFIGAETRNDHDVVYSGTCTSGSTALVCVPKRLDGTTFAYGVTSDAGVRYIFENGLAFYGGFRVQYIRGFQSYLAWGPIINMSLRFGR